MNAARGSVLGHHLNQSSASHNARMIFVKKKPFSDQYENKQHSNSKGETAFKFHCHFSFPQRLGGVQDFNHDIYEMEKKRL